MRPLVVFTLLLSFAAIAADEHPLKNARAGDWVQYKVTRDIGGKKSEATETQRVTKNDGKIVSFDQENKSAGTRVAGDISLYLDEPCEPEDPSSPLNYVAVKNAKIEILGQGDETLTVNGQEYPCHWVKRKISFETGKELSEYESKVWICKAQVPLFGYVRKEYTHTAPVKATLVHELIGHGTAEKNPKK